jgi:hypothetical protein
LHRAPFVEVSPAQDAAGLEGVHGDLGTGLALFDTTIDSFHQSGNAADTIGTLGTLGTLAILLDRFERAEPAASRAPPHCARSIALMNASTTTVSARRPDDRERDRKVARSCAR